MLSSLLPYWDAYTVFNSVGVVYIQVVSVSKLLSSVPPYWDAYTGFTSVDIRLGQINTLDSFIATAHRDSNIKVRVINLSL